MFEKPIDLVTISHPDNLNVRKDVVIDDEDGERKMQIQKKNTITPQELQQDFQKVNRR